MRRSLVPLVRPRAANLFSWLLAIVFLPLLAVAVALVFVPTGEPILVTLAMVGGFGFFAYTGIRGTLIGIFHDDQDLVIREMSRTDRVPRGAISRVEVVTEQSPFIRYYLCISRDGGKPMRAEGTFLWEFVRSAEARANVWAQRVLAWVNTRQ